MIENDSSVARSAGVAPTLAVVIVNFNAGELLVACVDAVLGCRAVVELVVSDNGSDDGSLDVVRARYGNDPRVTLVENGINLGFAAGNNRVLGCVSAPYVLFLNPDCIVEAHTMERIMTFMDTIPNAGMAGCIVRNPDGSEQVASRRIVPDPWIGLVRMLHLDRLLPRLAKDRRLDLTDQPLPKQPIQVDAISGSFMFVRRAALVDVGHLDEGYFLHCEDLDWFVRFRRAGWLIYLVPDAEAVHYKGVCSTRRPISVLWHKHRGMTRFFRKFQFREYPLPLSLLVILGIWLHFAAVVPGILLRRQIGRLVGL